MKRISTILAIILAFFSLCLPAAAETIGDLSKLYKNLTTYIHKPYFQSSQYFEEYETQINYVGELLKAKDTTQYEIDNGYQSLKTVYAKMMKDTYDYSKLQNLIDGFEKLDKTVFTDEAWNKLFTVVYETRKQLETPSIYLREKTDTEASYREKVQNYIDNFEMNYATAFNKLAFNEAFFDNNFTKEEIKSYHSFASACINEEYMKSIAEYSNVKIALEGAEDVFNLRSPSKSQIEQAKEKIDTAFLALNRKLIDFTAVQEEISTFLTLSESEYDENSFLSYSQKIKNLEEALKKPHYFYIPSDTDAESYKLFADIYLNGVLSPAKTAYGFLLPTRLVEQLQSICERYKNTTTITGLELKLNHLQTAIQNGQNLLQSENVSAEQYEKAIKTIDDAYSDLKTAEEFLIKEQSEHLSLDTEPIKKILIYAFISILLSVGFAFIVSKLQYGMMDWTK